MHVHGFNDEGARPNMTSNVIDILDGIDPCMREHMIDRFLDMADPTQSTVRAPSYNTEYRGRPKGRDEQSKSHMPSYGHASTAGSAAIQPNARS